MQYLYNCNMFSQTASMGYFCTGLFVGWSSHATFNLDKTVSHDRFANFVDKSTLRSLSAVQYESINSSETVARIASALALGAAISPMLVNVVWHAIGTKSTILFASLIMSTSVIGLYIKYVICRSVVKCVVEKRRSFISFPCGFVCRLYLHCDSIK